MSTDIIAKDTTLDRVALDIQINTAKAYPRDPEKFLKDAIFLATLDEETAESCIYSLPRGKDSNNKQEYLKGESVRLAEICVSAWGNMHAATRIVENDGKAITAEGVAWDLEKNVKIAKQVKRSIVDRFGKTYKTDMQIVTGNAASSIALRNAVFSVIPRSLVKRVYDAAVNFAIGDQKKFSDKVKEVFARFKKYGIDSEKILSYYDRKDISEITQDDLVDMIGVGTAIKDGNTAIEKAFVKEELTELKTSALETRLNQTTAIQSQDAFTKALD